MLLSASKCKKQIAKNWKLQRNCKKINERSKNVIKRKGDKLYVKWKG